MAEWRFSQMPNYIRHEEVSYQHDFPTALSTTIVPPYILAKRRSESPRAGAGAVTKGEFSCP
jgi:hypothetical protein